MDDPLYDVKNLPSVLFKFYGNNKDLNKKRLSGEVYLSSPLDFNDPCDCQRGIRNNAPEMEKRNGSAWIVGKVRELGFLKEEAEELAGRLIKLDTEAVRIVHEKQLEKSGVLCMSHGFGESLMWGYYTNNQGYCIEYDVYALIPGLVVGYVNNLDYYLTRFFFEEKRYYNAPKERTPDIEEGLLAIAEQRLDKSVLDKLRNRYLNEKTEKERLNFIQNVFLKRFVAQSIVYGVDPNACPSNLFFDNRQAETNLKYFCKTKTWEHEKEFRFFFSLGGRQTIKLEPEVIKSVYFGCNMRDEDVISFVYTIATLGLKNVRLYKMKKLKNGGLQKRVLDYMRYYPLFVEMGKSLNLR